METKLNSKLWVKNIVLFLTGQSVSLFGSSLVQYAIMWYIARQTDSGALVGLFAVVAFLPQVVIGMFGGVIADRFNRKYIILLADGSIALATLILAIIMMFGYENIGFIMFISAVRSVGAGIQSPAVSAVIPQIVPQNQLMRVNGIYSSITSVVNLAAPISAGSILRIGAFYNVLLIDVITACIAIGILLFIKIEMHKRSEENTSVIEDFKKGLSYTLSHKFIRYILNLNIWIFILIIPATMFNVLLVTRSFGSDYFYLTLNEVSFFIGATIGGIALASWGGFKNRMSTFNMGLIIFTISTIFLAIFSYFGHFYLYLVAMVVCGTSMSAFNSPVYVLLQEKVQPDHLGRVFSLLGVIGGAIMPLGSVIYGPIVDYVRIEFLMLINAVIMGVIIILVYRNKAFMAEGLPSPKVDEGANN